MGGTYIVIPTYNEAENIRAMINAIQNLNRGYRIIIVDDNSPDGTATIVREMQQFDKNILVLKRIGKLGIGSAIREGLKTALSNDDCCYIVTLDADFSHDPVKIPELLKESDNFDMVQGSRYIKGGNVIGWTWQRKFISRTANFLYRFLLRLPQHEITTYFRVYSRKCAEVVIQNVTADKLEFCVESALVIHDHSLNVKEVPIVFTNRIRGNSKLKKYDVVNSLRYLARIFIARLSRKLGVQRFIRFCTVGATGILVNQGLLWLLTDRAGIYYLYSSLISIEVSILSNFVLNDLWTFRDKRKTSSPVIIRLLKYNLLCVVGAAFNYFILWSLTDILHLYYLISNLFGIAAAVAWNYTISLNWAWVRKNSTKRP